MKNFGAKIGLSPDATSPKPEAMSLDARMRDLLVPSRYAASAQRIIADGDDAAPLAALLREVNETVLGRTLHFDTDSGSALAVDVAGRRVLRIVSATGLEGADAWLSVQTLTEAHREELAQFLAGFASSATTLRVVATALARGTDGVSVGLPVARLADHLAVDLNSLDPDPIPTPDPVEEEAVTDPQRDFLHRMIDAMGEGLVAWAIQMPDACQTRNGIEDMVSHLENFLVDEHDALVDQLSRLTDSPSGPVCSVLGAALGDGHSILCVRADGCVLVGVIAGDATSTVLNAWNTARG